MIIYHSTVSDFRNAVLNNQIADIIESNMLQYGHRHTNVNEKNSWTNSMMYMSNALEQAKLEPDVDVAIEFTVPNTSKRIDFLICGLDQQQKMSAVIVELKQWQYCHKLDGMDGTVITMLNGHDRPTTHPSYQALGYASLIEDYNEAVQVHRIELHPCAYLHNYVISESNNDVVDPMYHYYTDQAPVFVRQDAAKLATFIKHFITKSNKEVLYYLDNGRIRPSKALQDTVASTFAGNKEFFLIDDQKVIYEEILEAIRNRRNDRKTVFIVKGGPGTGKSVIAINLVGQIIRDGYNACYVSKNSAPRNVYSKLLRQGKYRQAQIDNLFKSSGSFVGLAQDTYDVILVDEAHRLTKKSGMYKNLGEDQTKELIQASMCTVFFVDDDQQVTVDDAGTSDHLKEVALSLGAQIEQRELKYQFRCNGSDDYLMLIRYLLGYECNYPDIRYMDYDLRVMDSPQEVFDLIESKNKINNKARVVAGYCWKWISEGKNNSDVHDIVIGDFEKSWNLGNSQTWSIDPQSINEIGCIHTCQGLEFDYVGVIIGPDLRYENGQVITDWTKRASSDKSVFGLKKRIRENPQEGEALAEKIVRNTYRTLMTRGQKGCYIYCCDQALADFMKRVIASIRLHF